MPSNGSKGDANRGVIFASSRLVQQVSELDCLVSGRQAVCLSTRPFLTSTLWKRKSSSVMETKKTLRSSIFIYFRSSSSVFAAYLVSVCLAGSSEKHLLFTWQLLAAAVAAVLPAALASPDHSGGRLYTVFINSSRRCFSQKLPARKVASRLSCLSLQKNFN